MPAAQRKRKPPSQHLSSAPRAAKARRLIVRSTSDPYSMGFQFENVDGQSFITVMDAPGLSNVVSLLVGCAEVLAQKLPHDSAKTFPISGGNKPFRIASLAVAPGVSAGTVSLVIELGVLKFIFGVNKTHLIGLVHSMATKLGGDALADAIEMLEQYHKR